MDFLKKLETILRDHFDEDSEFQLQLEISDAGQVTGVLTSTVFEDKEEFERQNLIWDVLDEELDEDERFQITLIIANTPEQTAILNAEERARDRIRRARQHRT